MTIQRELEPLVRYLSIAKLTEKTELPLKCLPEDVTHLLPSIVISGDGLTLARILLVTKNYLCDVTMTDSAVTFDVIAKSTVKNYRFRIWTHEIKEGDVVKARYDVAQIHLLHDLSPQFVTALDYAGDERDVWLRRVLEAIPVGTVLGP
jgi:hypothetical protein